MSSTSRATAELTVAANLETTQLHHLHRPFTAKHLRIPGTRSRGPESPQAAPPHPLGGQLFKVWGSGGGEGERLSIQRPELVEIAPNM